VGDESRESKQIAITGIGVFCSIGEIEWVTPKPLGPKP